MRPARSGAGGNSDHDAGSTIPLILGFFLIAFLTVAGSVAAGDVFVGQRTVQSRCDEVAAAVASTAVDLGREDAVQGERYLRFSGVQAAVDAYLGRDRARARLLVSAELSADGRTVSLACVQRLPVALGGAFGLSAGVRHTAHSFARAPAQPAG